MRTIKFRGKRTDNGEWVYGGYIDENTIAVPVNDYSVNYYGIDDFEVIPETVGQFTGLFDKDGAEIYEHDILEHANLSVLCLIVEYNDQLGSFQFDDNYYSLSDKSFRKIGNIHDKTSDQ